MPTTFRLYCCYLGLALSIVVHLTVIGLVDPTGLFGGTAAETAIAERPVSAEAEVPMPVEMALVPQARPPAASTTPSDTPRTPEAEERKESSEVSGTRATQRSPLPLSVEPAAKPSPTVSSEPSVPELSPGEAAFEALDFDLESLGYSIRFEGPIRGYLGLTLTQERVIEVYVRPGLTTDELSFVIAHELGHAVDHMRSNGPTRAQYRALRDLPDSSPWWPASAGPDHATGAGDFAECFATWLTGLTSHHVQDCDGTGDLIEQLVAGDNVRDTAPTV